MFLLQTRSRRGSVAIPRGARQGDRGEVPPTPTIRDPRTQGKLTFANVRKSVHRFARTFVRDLTVLDNLDNFVTVVRRSRSSSSSSSSRSISLLSAAVVRVEQQPKPQPNHGQDSCCVHAIHAACVNRPAVVLVVVLLSSCCCCFSCSCLVLVVPLSLHCSTLVLLSLSRAAVLLCGCLRP